MIKQCRQHTWAPMFPAPKNTAQALSFTVWHCARYMVCRQCGHVGWIRRSRRASIVRVAESAEAAIYERLRIYNQGNEPEAQQWS